ncbi:uncharacterized protein ARMOST_16315 [Armillaria ostoyae]|uniref:Peptidase C14 caspase domain-containing protein n=1 Tax=Armillaria ostoyae TaxID=47428 RepID=A0A284RVU3_ARMOS|nr:uncharacterized protein ARMOST_16315 [Armillaria ostoyae]
MGSSPSIEHPPAAPKVPLIDRSRLEEFENYERELATSYGMKGRVNSAEVFERAKGDMIEVEQLRSVRQPKLDNLKILRSIRELPSGPRHAFGQGSAADCSRIYAIIIGINNYDSDELKGCVADAVSINDYLTTKLRVPKERVRLLLGCRASDNYPNHSFVEPTRQNIVETLCSLASNTNIQHGDRIIIYYSGHGATYSCKELFPDGVASTGFIQAICSSDRQPFDAPPPTQPHDISGREINVILREVARSKGHHITLIMDCCFSGGGGRALQQEVHIRATAARAANSSLLEMLREGHDNLQRVFPTYHQNSASASIMDPHWRPDTSSYVLLAACQDYQRALEVNISKGEPGEGMPVEPEYRGVFTANIVDSLSSGLLDKGITFVHFVDSLPQWSRQTPLAAGDHKIEPLFFL